VEAREAALGRLVRSEDEDEDGGVAGSTWGVVHARWRAVHAG